MLIGHKTSQIPCKDYSLPTRWSHCLTKSSKLIQQDSQGPCYSGKADPWVQSFIKMAEEKTKAEEAGKALKNALRLLQSFLCLIILSIYLTSVYQ